MCCPEQAQETGSWVKAETGEPGFYRLLRPRVQAMQAAPAASLGSASSRAAAGLEAERLLGELSGKTERAALLDDVFSLAHGMGPCHAWCAGWQTPNSEGPAPAASLWFVCAGISVHSGSYPVYEC